MNRRFSNLAICILGGAFLTSPINQMKASASCRKMRLKSFLATFTCTAIVLGLSTISIAETSTESQVKIETAIALNKQHNDKLSAQLLLGNWKASVNQDGLLIDIYVIYKPNGTFDTILKSGEKRATYTGTWRYSNGVLTQHLSNGTKRTGFITFLSSNELIATVIDNGNPSDQGLKRRFSRYRVSNPSPNIAPSTLRLYQRVPHEINRNWIRSY